MTHLQKVGANEVSHTHTTYDNIVDKDVDVEAKSDRDGNEWHKFVELYLALLLPW